jgi:membrane protease YdiL (CAAX protease family)
MAANGAAEEFVLRGYLLTRIREATGSAIPAVAAVSALAAAYHLYQGSHSAAIVLAGQVVISAAYLRCPRLLPFAAAHGLYDLGIAIWRASV